MEVGSCWQPIIECGRGRAFGVRHSCSALRAVRWRNRRNAITPAPPPFVRVHCASAPTAGIRAAYQVAFRWGVWSSTAPRRCSSTVLMAHYQDFHRRFFLGFLGLRVAAGLSRRLGQISTIIRSRTTVPYGTRQAAYFSSAELTTPPGGFGTITLVGSGTLTGDLLSPAVTSNAVPEPGTILLLAAAGVSVAAWLCIKSRRCLRRAGL